MEFSVLMLKVSGIFILFFLLSCIDPIHFDANESDQVLVIEGAVHHGKGPHTLTISLTGNLGKQEFETIDDARAKLMTLHGENEDFHFAGDGRYETNGLIEGREGEGYFIEVIISSRLYRSLVEIMPAKVVIDRAHFSMESEEEFQESDLVQVKPYFKVYSAGTIPEGDNNVFIRWDVENVYKVTERFCSSLSGPKICYIRQPVNDHSLSILDGTHLSPGGTFDQLVTAKIIDYSFGERQTFLVFQNSITGQEYSYWNKINEVLLQQGSIFNVPPASVRGNIYNMSDPEHLVLGYFSAVNSDTALISVTRFDLDLGFEQLPFCGLPGFYKEYIPECCNCLSLKNASYQRPDYW